MSINIEHNVEDDVEITQPTNYQSIEGDTEPQDVEDTEEQNSDSEEVEETSEDVEEEESVEEEVDENGEPLPKDTELEEESESEATTTEDCAELKNHFDEQIAGLEKRLRDKDRYIEVLVKRYEGERDMLQNLTQPFAEAITFLTKDMAQISEDEFLEKQDKARKWAQDLLNSYSSSRVKNVGYELNLTREEAAHVNRRLREDGVDARTIMNNSPAIVKTQIKSYMEEYRGSKDSAKQQENHQRTEQEPKLLNKQEDIEQIKAENARLKRELEGKKNAPPIVTKQLKKPTAPPASKSSGKAKPQNSRSSDPYTFSAELKV